MVIYLSYGPVEPIVDVVGGWDAGWVGVGDVDDFHGATNISASPTRQLEVDDFIQGAESASTDPTLDKVSISYHVSDEGKVVIGSGRAIRLGGRGHGEAGRVVPERCDSMVHYLYGQYGYTLALSMGSGLETGVQESDVIEVSVGVRRQN